MHAACFHIDTTGTCNTSWLELIFPGPERPSAVEDLAQPCREGQRAQGDSACDADVHGVASLVRNVGALA